MKKEDNFKTTSHPRVYKNDRIARLGLTMCSKCSPHKGCNIWQKKMRSWKDLTSKRKQWMS
jgi:hypothetical protein